MVFRRLVSQCINLPLYFSPQLSMSFDSNPTSIQFIFLHFHKTQSISCCLRFDVGASAIPINMMMLGSTLCQGVASIPRDFRWAPNLAVAFGKLVIMPTIGLLSVIGIHSFLPVSNEIIQSMYFAMLIVTTTPTANNINVMAEVNTSASTF